MKKRMQLAQYFQMKIRLIILTDGRRMMGTGVICILVGNPWDISLRKLIKYRINDVNRMLALIEPDLEF